MSNEHVEEWLEGASCSFQPLPSISGRYPSRDEERELIRIAQTGDDRARDFLVEVNLPFIKRRIAKYLSRNQKYSLEELLTDAVLGYMHAIRKFDLARNTRLTTYSAQWIFQAINRFVLNNRSVMRVPIYAQATDRKPHLKDSIKESSEVALKCKRLSSIDNSCAVQKEAEEEPESPYPDMESVIAIIEKMDDEIRQLIFYGIMEGKTLDEIAPLIGVSRERIRQIRNEIFEYIRRKS